MKIKKFLLVVLLSIVLLSTAVFATEIQPRGEVEPEVQQEENADNIEGEPEFTSLIEPRDGVDEVEVEGTEDADVLISNTVENREFIDDDYFRCDKNVEITSMQIEGNAFLIGEKVSIEDTRIGGSLFIVAQELDIYNVDCSGSLYVVGQNLKTKNTTFINAYTLSQNVEFDSVTNVIKSLYTVTETCTYNAQVTQNANILGNTVYIKDEASVLGEMNVTATSNPEMPDTVSIENYNFNKVKEIDDTGIKKSETVFSKIKSVISYLVSTVLIALILVKLVPNLNEKVSNYSVGKLALNALVGLGLIIIIPLAAILALCTGLLTQISLASIFVYALAFSVCSPFAAIVIAMMIANKKGKDDVKVLVSLTSIVAIVVSILNLIPVVSGIVTIVMGLIGFGTLFKLLFSKENKETK